ncbi:MAG: DUF427 domain-containing protein [Pseudomonadales bacterium]
MWQYRGDKRPPFADRPAIGQESVWDYPRPPRLEPFHRGVEVRCNDTVIARASGGYRVLETASPPSFYLASNDIDWSQLIKVSGSSLCEWKGLAAYWALTSEPESDAVAWSYSDPHRKFAALHNHISFYPGRVACYVDGERVRPQAGKFYGGWITNELVGPFKGEPGSEHW